MFDFPRAGGSGAAPMHSGAAAAGFRFSKIIKLLASSTALCSAVLSVGLICSNTSQAALLDFSTMDGETFDLYEAANNYEYFIIGGTAKPCTDGKCTDFGFANGYVLSSFANDKKYSSKTITADLSDDLVITNSTITTVLQVTGSKSGPDAIGTAVFNVKGHETSSGALPTITVYTPDTTKGQDFNYALQATYGGILNIDSVNLNFESVAGGISTYNDYLVAGSINISNNDFVYMGIGVNDDSSAYYEHRGIFSGMYYGSVSIKNSGQVKFWVTGYSQDLNNAGIFLTDNIGSAGSVKITDVGSGGLTFIVDTETSGVNSGIQITTDHLSVGSATRLVVNLSSSKDSSGNYVADLTINVSGSSAANYGINAATVYGKSGDAMFYPEVTAVFKNITITAEGSETGADYGIYADKRDGTYYAPAHTTVNLVASDTISIEAARGIDANAYGEYTTTEVNLGSTEEITTKNITINSAVAVESFSSDQGMVFINLNADEIAVTAAKTSSSDSNAAIAFTAVIAHNVESSSGEAYPSSLRSASLTGRVDSKITVLSDNLTASAKDGFLALAYTAASSLEFERDGEKISSDPNSGPQFDPGYVEGVAQINLNLTDVETGQFTNPETGEQFGSGRVVSATPYGTATLTGGAFASHYAQINIGLGDGSTWTGFSEDSRVNHITHEVDPVGNTSGVTDPYTLTDTVPGEVNVYAAGGAVWNVRPVQELSFTENKETTYSSSSTTSYYETVTTKESKSYLTSWNSQGSSVINLNLTGSGVTYKGNEYQPVDIKYLQGSGTEFQVHTNVDGDRGEGLSTDQAIIHSGSGAHSIYVAISGSGQTESQADYLILHLEEDGATSTERDVTDNGDGSFTINTKQNGDNDLSFVLVDSNGNTTSTVVAQGLYYYSLATREAQSDVKEEYGLEDGKGTEWYLVRTSENVVEDPDPTPIPDPQPDPGPGPSKDPETNEGKTVAALSGIGNKLSMHYAQLDDLRKRLGEVRYGAQDGLWVRYIYQRSKYDGVSSNVSARQNLHAINLGLDRIVSQDEDSMWMLGGNFKYGHDNERIKSARGKGNLNSYGLNLYATYANQYGCYTDLVLSFDDYHQKIGSKLEDNSSASGKFNTWGWGASVEIGKMFSSTQNDENWGPWHNHWWVEPQAQLSYYWIKGKDFSMNNGMTVSQHNGDSLVGRLGVVVGKQWSYGGSDKVDKRYVQAYLKGGVKHEFLGNQKTKLNGVAFDHKLRGTAGYYGAGVDWNLTKQVKAYAQVERDAGGRYKKDIEASIGLKWQF